MGSRYGTFAAKTLVERGRFEEAITLAELAIEENRNLPEAYFARALAHEAVGDWPRAAQDHESALAHNEAKEVDPFELDDAYFAVLVGWAQALASQSNRDAAAAAVNRYAKNLPNGSHAAEVSTWEARVRGTAPSLLDKTRDM